MAATCLATVTLSPYGTHSIVSLKFILSGFCVAATPARSSWKTVSDGSQVSQDLPICAVPRIDWLVGCNNRVRRHGFVIATTAGERIADTNADPNTFIYPDANAQAVAYCNTNAPADADGDAQADRDTDGHPNPDAWFHDTERFAGNDHLRFDFERRKRSADACAEQHVRRVRDGEFGYGVGHGVQLFGSDFPVDPGSQSKRKSDGDICAAGAGLRSGQWFDIGKIQRREFSRDRCAQRKCRGASAFCDLDLGRQRVAGGRIQHLSIDRSWRSLPGNQ